MAPVRKLLNVRQGDRNIEVYARDFMGVARQSATEKACLMVFFWGGLAELFKSRMPYWHPEESLEEYVNLALILSGSAFRVEWAVEPAPVWESTESAPEPAPLREPTESAPESASPQSPLRSVSPQSPLQSPLWTGSPQNPLKKPLLSSGCYLLHPGGVLLCLPRPGTPVCLFLRALFHSTCLAHRPYPRSKIFVL